MDINCTQIEVVSSIFTEATLCVCLTTSWMIQTSSPEPSVGWCVYTYTGKYHILIYNGHFIGRRPSPSVGGQQYLAETQYMDLDLYIVCCREALTSETTATSGSAFIINKRGGGSKLASLLTKSSYVCIARPYSGVGSRFPE